jgi:hypothetical protein
VDLGAIGHPSLYSVLVLVLRKFLSGRASSMLSDFSRENVPPMSNWICGSLTPFFEPRGVYIAGGGSNGRSVSGGSCR